MRDGHLLNEQMKMVRFLKSNKLAQNQVSSGVKRFFFREKLLSGSSTQQEKQQMVRRDS